MNNFQKIIYAGLIQEIITGKYLPGDKIATESELSKQYGVTLSNAHYALDCLKNAGLISRDKRGGSRILRLPSPPEVPYLKRFLSSKVKIINHMPQNVSPIFWNETLEYNLRKILEAQNLSLEIFNSPIPSDAAEYTDFITRTAENAAAIIIIPGQNNYAEYLLSSQWFALQCDHIFLYTRASINPETYKFNVIALDNQAEGMLSARMAFSSGQVRRVIFCGDSGSNNSWLKQRRIGLENGVKLYSGNQLHVEFFSPGVFGEFPFQKPDIATVLVAANDECGVKLIEAGKKLSMKPGRDYRLIGFDDNPLFRSKISDTVAPDLPEIGNAMGKLIVKCLKSDGKCGRSIQFIPPIAVHHTI